MVFSYKIFFLTQNYSYFQLTFFKDFSWSIKVLDFYHFIYKREEKSNGICGSAPVLRCLFKKKKCVYKIKKTFLDKVNFI